jgi:hypothetical protein
MLILHQFMSTHTHTHTHAHTHFARRDASRWHNAPMRVRGYEGRHGLVFLIFHLWLMRPVPRRGSTLPFKERSGAVSSCPLARGKEGRHREAVVGGWRMTTQPVNSAIPNDFGQCEIKSTLRSY